MTKPMGESSEGLNDSKSTSDRRTPAGVRRWLFKSSWACENWTKILNENHGMNDFFKISYFECQAEVVCYSVGEASSCHEGPVHEELLLHIGADRGEDRERWRVGTARGSSLHCHCWVSSSLTDEEWWINCWVAPSGPPAWLTGAWAAWPVIAWDKRVEVMNFSK